MSDLRAPPGDRLTALETYGVRVAVRAPDEAVLSHVRAFVPPHSKPCNPGEIAHRFTVMAENGRRWSVQYDIRDGEPAQPVDPNSWIATEVDFEFALGLLESYWHGALALNAPEHFFVQAGVVAYEGRLIVMLGKGLTGKTTLVTELLDLGATYYSDEYAVLDRDGRVHPYAVALPRSKEAAPEPLPIDAPEPLPIDAVVATGYFPGAEWRPRRLSHGEGLLALLSHAVPAQSRPEETMAVLKKALEHEPTMIESRRDQAGPVASLLLAEIAREAPTRV